MELTEQGRLLSGRYRLRTVVGQGGMGVVWQARDELLNRDVAVKELVWPPHFTEAEGQIACRRAVREAQMAGRVAHLNVVRIYDILQEDGHPWIIMELLPYQSLRDLVRQDGPLAPARAARVGLGVLAALVAAHAEGVLHRDVKPANILVGADGRVVLTDFGIARAVDSPTLTTAGALVGSPSYIAPERARGGQSSPAGDLWGLGASLYAAVEGRPPFERDAPLATLTAVVVDEPEPAVHAGPLWPVISGLLRKDPDERPDPAETERMLREVADHDEVPAAGLVEAPVAADSSAAPASRRPRRSRRAAIALAALITVAVGATVTAVALTSSPGRSAASGRASSPSVSHQARSSGAQTPGASTTPSAAASAATASANPPASPASTPASAPASPGSVGYGALLAGYFRFTNSTGFSIGVPDGWQIQHVGHYVYIVDPSNDGIYLLIDQSDTPKPNALADWEQQAANRASGYPDYHLIRLESVDYPQAEQAADWEFTYVRDGILVHILSRNVLANAHHAYALYWSAPESDWSAYFRYFQAFADTFHPAQ
jgi:eukaryotic-like serine/threonine-protein kinase